MKKSLFRGTAIGALALIVTAVLASRALGKPKGTPPAAKIEIKGCAKKKKPVTFDHAKHVKETKNKCETCHHLIKGKADPQAKCTACHAKPQGSLGTCQDMGKTKNPFHKACITCHTAAKKEAAPTKCAGCHR
jgi:hypothetical protein